jgi:hypothetical protein
MLASTTVFAPIVSIFRINDDLLPKALNGLGPEQLWHRLTDKTNPMLWIAGHLVQTRADILALTGNPFDTGWAGLFARGSSVGNLEKYPSIEEILRVLGQINQKFYTTLESLKEEQLSADTLAGFALHDSYHLGQLAYIRRGLGHPAIAG